MKKKLSIAVTTCLLLGLTANLAWGTAYTLKAENGQLLAPAGLGVNVSSNLVAGSGFTARAGYGIARNVTLAATWQQSNLTWTMPDLESLRLKAYFSPTRGKSGYTAYLGYQPYQQAVTDYGISFWKNFRFLYTFINLDFPQVTNDNHQSMRLTPGVSLRLSPRVRVAAELETDPFQWKAEAISLGVGYNLYDRLTAKAGATQNLTGGKGRTYSLGVALEM